MITTEERLITLSTLSKTTLYTLVGTVVHGRGIGKLVGTPTADIQLSSPQTLPPIGVYISTVIWRNQKYASVTNIGNRPTIDNDDHISVETLILDFHSDIYGAEISIELLKFIRLPQKFPSLSELRDQVFRDCETARTFWGIYPNHAYNNKRSPSERFLQLGSLRIDTHKRCAIIQSTDIQLTTKEYELLYLLSCHPGWAYSKDQIYEAIWHEPANASYHPVENLICQLRKKLSLKSDKNIPVITTIVGYGYKLLI
ncbi:MAG: riboflavin kinase [Lachnospiraceae bacterium]|nr:riboflavin kinase [Lachnospiraceae bacterium]